MCRTAPVGSELPTEPPCSPVMCSPGSRAGVQPHLGSVSELAACMAPAKASSAQRVRPCFGSAWRRTSSWRAAPSPHPRCAAERPCGRLKSFLEITDKGDLYQHGYGTVQGELLSSFKKEQERVELEIIIFAPRRILFPF